MLSSNHRKFQQSFHISLLQKFDALGIIYEAGLLGAKHALLSIEQNYKLGHATGAYLTNPEKYRRLVGCLIYLVVIRPDLSYTIHIISQFSQILDMSIEMQRYIQFVI